MARITRGHVKTSAEVGSSLWARLRGLTPARIGLGRVGASLPTQALLDFELAHARARDAVEAVFDTAALVRDLREDGFDVPAVVSSQARDRIEYLLRPDLGRALNPESCETMRALAKRDQAPELVVVIGDGLSALAPARHAVPLLRELRTQWGLSRPSGRDKVTVVVANQARVALGDQIGDILHADAVVVLIGERPGLTSPDSLGIYLTWAPRVERTDAERNCISNVRPQGLPYSEAARRLVYLLGEAQRLKQSGIALKDDSESGLSLPRTESQPLSQGPLTQDPR